jgi:alanyl-tRNA synthetase
MNRNVLRAPLIKSAIVLVIFSLLVYFTSTSPEGSVWTSIGTIFVAGFRTIQWAVALSIGLIVCIAVMIGIFLGAAALFNPASASRMFEALLQTLSAWITPVAGIFASEPKEKLTTVLDGFGNALKKDISADIQSTRSDLKNTRTELETKLGSISSRLTDIEQATTALAPVEQVETLAGEVKGTVETADEIKTALDSLKSSIDKTAKRVQELSGEAILGDLPARLEALEQKKIPEPPPAVDITPIQKDIAAVQAELAALKKQLAEEPAKDAAPAAKAATKPAAKKAPKKPPAKAAPAKANKDEEHRIFSYFDNDDDKKKVAELVASTLKKDMSYKQVMDFVAKKLGGKKGEMITSHPSLSKDYIRMCRKKA